MLAVEVRRLKPQMFCCMCLVAALALACLGKHMPLSCCHCRLCLLWAWAGAWAVDGGSLRRAKWALVPQCSSTTWSPNLH